MKAVKVKVSGRVLRTGYRWYVADLAREMGLTGYVEIAPEGHLNIFVQGEDAKISEYLDRLRNPPEPSSVKELSVEESKPDSKTKFFTVKYGSVGDELHEGFGPIQFTLEQHLRGLTERLEGLRLILEDLRRKVEELSRPQRSP